MQTELLDRDATCRFFGGTRPINQLTGAANHYSSAASTTPPTI